MLELDLSTRDRLVVSHVEHDPANTNSQKLKIGHHELETADFHFLSFLEVDVTSSR